jgi:pimeloyl-ACP methyl ester carboxylesterase
MSEEDKKFLYSRVIDRVQSNSQECAYFSSLRSIIRFSLIRACNFSMNVNAYNGKILLIWGDSDRVIPFEKTARFCSMHPGAEYRIIPNAGHLPHQEAPLETARAIIDELK